MSHRGRFDAQTRLLASGALQAGTALDPGLRRAAFVRAGEHAGAPATTHLEVATAGTAPLPPDLLAFVDRLATDAHRITRADVRALVDAGHDQEAIFELVTAAAVGAGFARLELGLAALDTVYAEET